MSFKTNVQPAPRLHKLTKADIILELVLSLNKGNSLSADVRVEYAERQYNDMLKRGIIKEG